MYLNYTIFAEVNDPDDNPPIGIILCTGKETALRQNMLWVVCQTTSFASRYVLYMPNKEQLIAQVEAVKKLERKERQRP